VAAPTRFELVFSTNSVCVASKQVWDSKRVFYGAKARRDWVETMRTAHAMAGIASAGLVAASLVMGAPASAMNTVNGTSGNDHLRGTPHSDTIRGFKGRDRVYALAGADRVRGGAGTDKVHAGRGDDTIQGGGHNDYLYGGPGADLIVGGEYILDGSGVDTIHAGLGGEYIYLTKDRTHDTVHCGSGHDFVWGATSENTIAADCENVYVGPAACRSLPQRVLPPLREAARC
jgi:Ca2+-binding RTX toxin-like protein